MICEGSATLSSGFSLVRCIGRGSLSSRSYVDRDTPPRCSCYRLETLCRDEMRLLDRLEVLCCQGGDQETGPHGPLPHFLVGSPGDGPARLAARNARVFSSASLAAGSLYSTEWPNARRPGCRAAIEGMVGVLIDMQRNRRAVGPRMGNHLATAFRRG